MKLTLKEIRDAQQGLTQLSQINMPSKSAYRVARVIRKIKPEVEDIENKRIELAKKHGATSKASVPEENVEAFGKEFDEFLTSEVEVDVQPITEELLDGLNLQPSALVNLEKFI